MNHSITRPLLPTLPVICVIHLYGFKHASYTEKSTIKKIVYSAKEKKRIDTERAGLFGVTQIAIVNTCSYTHSPRYRA